MVEQVITNISFLQPFLPYIVLSIIVWITYVYCVLRAGFVSDDLMGICEFDGKLQGFEYGMISRWLRFWICGGTFPSKHRLPDQQGPDGKITKGNFIPCGKVASRHHALSIIIFNLAILSTYALLSKLIGPEIAFLASALFIVHPVVTQGVAWASGLGYPLSLFWITLSINLTLWYYTLPSPTLLTTIFILILFSVIHILAINALFIALASWAILLFLGHYPFALIAFLISIREGLKIVRLTIKLRADEFKKQSMGASTYFKPRKLIVATKTLLYYLKHTLWPNRMGLYHEWGYHYEKVVEREDRYFLLGLIAIIGLVTWFFLTPVFAVKFAIIWFMAFVFIFLNWITIQQFVTERYIIIPSLGACIILAYYLHDYIGIYMLIFGMALVRTWMHLPTYDDELRFYLSNTWNFKNSEVALGNLGVTNVRIGRIGTALDVWHQAIQVNPEYDVPYYNIYSHHRSNAMFQLQRGNFQGAHELLKQAYPYLDKCTRCAVCHFKNDWEKELVEIKSFVDNPVNLLLYEKKRQLDLKASLEARAKAPKDTKDLEGILSSLNDITKALDNIDNVLKQLATQPMLQR